MGLILGNRLPASGFLEVKGPRDQDYAGTSGLGFRDSGFWGVLFSRFGA